MKELTLEKGIQNQKNMGSYIIGSSSMIDAIEEFENVLKDFPFDPVLHKTFGDLLLRENMFDDAGCAYRQASKLFIDTLTILPAIGARIMEWKASMTSHHDCRDIYAVLQEIGPQGSLPQKFFARLSYPELTAIIRRMTYEVFSAGTIVTEFNTLENNIYFVVSGTLCETLYLPLKEGERVHSKSTSIVSENDFLGDIYPFTDDIKSHTSVETIIGAELIAISKPNLVDVCRKYPNIEVLIKELHKEHDELREGKPSQVVRKTTRYQIQTKVSVKILEKDKVKRSVILNGFTQNVSLGGACIALGEKYWTGSPSDLIGKEAEIVITIPKADEIVTIPGTIMWGRELFCQGQTTVVIGVQFKEMNREEFDVLKKHCYVGESEQDLICSLWETLIKK